jgi:hypothetical protein
MHAAEETRRVQALRALVGQQGVERYQAYTRTLAERTQVNQFDERLRSEHKLTPEQKERLIALYGEHNAAQHRAPDTHRQLAQPFDPRLSADELRRMSQLSTIALNEEIWRQMPAQHRALREQAAAILTPAQLDVLGQLQQERTDGLRRWIEQARAGAGLDSRIPNEPDAQFASKPPPATYEGDVSVRIRVSVDSEQPVRLTQVVRNGGSVELSSASGLIVRAVPTLYDDDTFDVRMTFFEEAASGRRLIGEMGQMGTVTRISGALDGSEILGHAATVVTGSKGYAIAVNAQVEPM